MISLWIISFKKPVDLWYFVQDAYNLYLVFIFLVLLLQISQKLPKIFYNTLKRQNAIKVHKMFVIKIVKHIFILDCIVWIIPEKDANASKYEPKLWHY